MKATYEKNTGKKIAKTFLSLLLTLLLLLPSLAIPAVSQESSPAPTAAPDSLNEELLSENTDWEIDAAEPEQATLSPLKEGDLSREALAHAKLDPQTLPLFLSLDEAEERSHIKRLTAQEFGEKTAVFQNRNGSKTLYCELTLLTKEPSALLADSEALYAAIEQNFNLKPEQIGSIAVENGILRAEYSALGGPCYINSLASGLFLTFTNLTTKGARGTTSQLGSKAVWNLQYVADNNYYIRHVEGSTVKYLQYQKEKPTTVQSKPNDENEAKWTILPKGSGYTITSVKSPDLSFFSSGNLSGGLLQLYPPKDNELPDGRNRIFLILDANEYQAKQLTDFTLSTYEIVCRIDTGRVIQITKQSADPSNMMLAGVENFGFSSSRDYLFSLTQNNKTFGFTTLEIGSASITIYHAPSGIKKVVNLTIVPKTNNYKLVNREKGSYLDFRYQASQQRYIPIQTSSVTQASTNFSFELSSSVGYYYVKASNGLYLTASTDNSVFFSEKKTNSSDQLWFYRMEYHHNVSWSTGRFYSKMNENQALAVDSSGSIVLRNYTQDSDYTDEWTLFMEDTTTLALMGNSYGDVSMHKLGQSINQSIRKIPFVYPNTYRHMDRKLVTTAMRQGDIVIFNSHGAKDRVRMSDVAPGDTEAYLTMEHIKALPSGALNDLKLVIYIACSTAKGGASADNLFKATVDKGAQIVIGFSEAIFDPECNYWNEGFFYKLSQSSTVREAYLWAHQYAETMSGTKSMENSFVISGNDSQFLFQYQ